MLWKSQESPFQSIGFGATLGNRMEIVEHMDVMDIKIPKSWIITYSMDSLT
jgi:hypothetical protein